MCQNAPHHSSTVTSGGWNWGHRAFGSPGVRKHRSSTARKNRFRSVGRRGVGRNRGVSFCRSISFRFPGSRHVRQTRDSKLNRRTSKQERETRQQPTSGQANQRRLPQTKTPFSHNNHNRRSNHSYNHNLQNHNLCNHNLCNDNDSKNNSSSHKRNTKEPHKRSAQTKKKSTDIERRQTTRRPKPINDRTQLRPLSRSKSTEPS